MAERPEDLNLPITVVQRIIKEAVRIRKHFLIHHFQWIIIKKLNKATRRSYCV